jgi:phospholipase C
VSWRYYTPSPGSIWTGPNAIQHICGPNANPPNATACTGQDWTNNVILYTSQNPAPILTDIANNQLPAVSWVIPAGKNSDHAGSTATTGGPSWVASIVNAVGASTYWPNTAIIITWDDWGGWYDHVPPPKVVNDGTSWGSGYVYGFRVPLIVISPYAKARYISHVTHDFGSILGLVENIFSLKSLGYADAYADDLSDCFDFNQTPIAFKSFDAPLSAAHFLTDRTPPTDPDDD